MIDDEWADWPEQETVASPPPEKLKRRKRRAHQCHHNSCDSAAEYEVYVHLRYGWHLIAQEHLKSTIRVCSRHKRAAHDLIMSDHNKRTVTRELAKIGRLSLDWPNAVIEFVPCGEVAWNPEQMMPISATR